MCVLHVCVAFTFEIVAATAIILRTSCAKCYYLCVVQREQCARIHGMLQVYTFIHIYTFITKYIRSILQFPYPQLQRVDNYKTTCLYTFIFYIFLCASFIWIGNACFDRLVDHFEACVSLNVCARCCCCCCSNEIFSFSLCLCVAVHSAKIHEKNVQKPKKKDNRKDEKKEHHRKFNHT